MIVTREENVTADHVMFAGDENQVINQSDFKWKSFFTGHKRLIEELSRCYRGDLNYNSYLVSPAAKALGDERIDNFVHNYRNLPSIVETWKRAGSWKPESSMLPDLEGIEECVSMVYSAADSGAVKFVYISAPENNTGNVSSSRQAEAVEEVIKFVSERSGISVISMSDIVDRFKEREDGDPNGLFTQTELYTPNTIKGLERDAVILLGTLAHNQPLSEKDIEAERMKLIVGMSRGKKKLIVFTPFARDGSHLNFANTPDLQGTQYPLNHFITDNHQVVEITSNEDIKEKFELLLPRNDQLASFIALEELMQANAYGSDQIAATRKRVVAIMEHDLQPRNPSDSATESLFAHYVEHELKFVPRDSQKIPIEVEVFLLLDADDSLNSLLGRYDFKPTDGPVADLLLRYNNYYLQAKKTGNRIQMIQSRHELYTAYDQYITKLEKKGVQRKYDVENVEKIIYRFEQNIVDGLHEIQKNMAFHEYPWTENIKNIQSLPC